MEPGPTTEEVEEEVVGGKPPTLDSFLTLELLDSLDRVCTTLPKSVKSYSMEGSNRSESLVRPNDALQAERKMRMFFRHRHLKKTRRVGSAFTLVILRLIHRYSRSQLKWIFCTSSGSRIFLVILQPKWLKLIVLRA